MGPSVMSPSGKRRHFLKVCAVFPAWAYRYFSGNTAAFTHDLVAFRLMAVLILSGSKPFPVSAK